MASTSSSTSANKHDARSCCDTCTPKPVPTNNEADDVDVHTAQVIQTRFQLPPSLIQLQAMLRLILQDMDRLTYSIPFLPTPLVDLISEYAMESSSHEQSSTLAIQASICTFPVGINAAHMEHRAEYHSARQLRARIAQVQLADGCRDILASAYLLLRVDASDEVLQFKKSHRIPLALPGQLEEFHQLLWHSQGRYCRVSNLPIRVICLAANRMAELLVQIARTEVAQRTAFQREVWERCGQRDLLLKHVRDRVLLFRAPLAQVINKVLIEDASSDCLFNFVEFAPRTGELLTTTRMAPGILPADSLDRQIKRDSNASNHSSLSYGISSLSHSSTVLPSSTESALFHDYLNDYAKIDHPLFWPSE